MPSTIAEPTNTDHDLVADLAEVASAHVRGDVLTHAPSTYLAGDTIFTTLLAPRSMTFGEQEDIFDAFAKVGREVPFAVAQSAGSVVDKTGRVRMTFMVDRRAAPVWARFAREAVRKARR